MKTAMKRKYVYEDGSPMKAQTASMVEEMIKKGLAIRFEKDGQEYLALTEKGRRLAGTKEN